jgi:large subunit ribosomal protein L17
MRHGNKTKKLNRTSSHRDAMLANMAVSLVLHEQITTTLPKAKCLRPVVEKLVTLGKQGDFEARKRLFSLLRSDLAVAKLIDVVASRYASRAGGYLRIMRAGFRYGDMAPVAVIEFVDRDVTAKGKEYGKLSVKDIVAPKEAAKPKKTSKKAKVAEAA